MLPKRKFSLLLKMVMAHVMAYNGASLSCMSPSLTYI